VVATRFIQLVGALVLHGTLGAAATFAQSAIPQNIHVAPSLRATVRDMWDTSPRFREQCRLIGATTIPVTIGYVHPRELGGLRAKSVFYRAPAGLAYVRTSIGRAASLNTVELVAHELEHIVEQIEGLRLVEDAGRGVRRVSGSQAFETERAIAVGEQVLREVRHARAEQHLSARR
jgi:hypothetical protein